MNANPEPLSKLWDPLWKIIHPLWTQHSLLTIVAGFLVVMMTLSFYRFLKSISPALVGVILLLVVIILMLHWTQTRTEPPFLSPAIDWLNQTIPVSPYAPPRPPAHPH
jgi:hypothetical protein